MRTLRSLSLVSLVAAVAASTACRDGTAPTRVQTTSLEPLFTEAEQAQSFGAMGAVAGGALFTAPQAGPRGSCVWSDADALFVCPTRTAGGLTISTSFQLLDAANNSLKAYDPARVAAIRTISDLEGTLTSAMPSGGGTMSMSVRAHDDATLSGLLTTTHVLNSTGQSSMTMSGGGMPSSTIRTTQTTRDLVLPEPRAGSPYPRSGSITIETSAGDGALMSRVTMTFNGTSTVTMQMTFGTTSRTCTMDLGQRGVPPTCQ